MQSHPFRIHTEPNDHCLRQISADISVSEIITPEMQVFFDHLIAAMIDFQGIGIAATQIGKPVNVFVVDKEYVDEEYLLDDQDHLVLINPRMASKARRTGVQEEGCLSVPNVYGPIERATKVRLKAYRRDGSLIDIKAKGMFARILQHEYDHLQGKLFIDSALSLSQHENV